MLYPPVLRDVLTRLAAAEFYNARWSEEILVELERNLRRRIPETHAAERIRQLNELLPEATTPRQAIAPELLKNHPKDQHVVATAIASEAQVIVTNNLKDFRPLPPGIRAMLPDAFLCTFLSQRNPLHDVLDGLRMEWPEPPPLTYLLEKLELWAPQFVSELLTRE